MNVVVEPGKYVLAVSGGVDSVVLLDILRQQPDIELVVAHFDHGIRSDSAVDAEFVRDLAAGHDLAFFTDHAELGPDASEATARTARYAFLRRVCKEQGAQAIITAHHQDDLLETAIHNLLRGTGRRGLTSLQSTPELLRPLLGQPKQALLDYALQQKLSWREDTTNHDDKYTRNYIRHRLLVRFDPAARQRLLTIITQLTQLNAELDAGLAELLAGHANAQAFDRRWFSSLPHDVSKEIMATFLRQVGVTDYDRLLLERLAVLAKTKRPGKRFNIRRDSFLELDTDTVQFTGLAKPPNTGVY